MWKICSAGMGEEDRRVGINCINRLKCVCMPIVIHFVILVLDNSRALLHRSTDFHRFINDRITEYPYTSIVDNSVFSIA